MMHHTSHVTRHTSEGTSHKTHTASPSSATSATWLQQTAHVSSSRRASNVNIARIHVCHMSQVYVTCHLQSNRYCVSSCSSLSLSYLSQQHDSKRQSGSKIRGWSHVLPVRFDLDAIGRVERKIAREIVDMQSVVRSIPGGRGAGAVWEAKNGFCLPFCGGF